MLSDDYQLRLNKAIELEQVGKVEPALDIYKELIEVFPRVPALYFNMGNISFDIEDFQEAENYFKKAIKVDPSFKEAHFNLANTLKRLEKKSEAAYHYERVLQIDPKFESAYFNLANLAKENGKFLTAIRNYKELLALKPSNHVARNNLIFTYTKKIKSLFYSGKFQEIKGFLEESLKYDPDNQRTLTNAAIYYFYMGDYEKAFSYYKSRYSNEKRQFRSKEFYPLKLEQIKERHILLIHEQGIGDQLFFLRFAPKIKEKGFLLSVVADAKLLPLLKTSKLFENCYSSLNQVDDDLEAFPMLMGDAAFSLGIKKAANMPQPLSLTPSEKSLKAAEKDLETLRDKPIIALSWRAGAMSEENFMSEGEEAPYSKHIEVEKMAELLKPFKDIVHLVSIQRNPQKAEFKRLQEKLGVEVHDFSHYNKHLENMLALLSLTDDYVTVSNTNVHLYASLGKAAHMLISYPWDWRWVGLHDICVGYPFFQAYRQDPEGKWADLKKAENHLSQRFL